MRLVERLIWKGLNSMMGFSLNSGTVSPVPLKKEEVEVGDIIGQEDAKKALMIAAYGGHNVLMLGPPGEGKTLLARSIVKFLPLLEDEAVAQLKDIYSNSALSWEGRTPPFIPIAPSITKSALIGGGYSPSPGAISFAHSGVLFIDELPELTKTIKEALRGPIESRSITITRGGIIRVYPCDFQLIASMNPCPCGFDGYDKCSCSRSEIERYRKKVSGPITDRMDMVIWVGKSSPFVPNENHVEPTSQQFRAKITAAINFRLKSREDFAVRPCDIPPKQIVKQDSPFMRWSKDGFDRFYRMSNNLSIRQVMKLGMLSRSVADLIGQEEITWGHVEYSRKLIWKVL